jgi:DNA-binding HxlR family transcriptional regulator
VQRKSFEDMACSVAHSLEVVGEWWTLLIVRDLQLGVTRFDDFQARTGISRNVLADRLAKLVDTGIVTKVPYQQNPERFDYRLTEKGKDLWPVVNALREWGDKWEAPNGPPIELEHVDCGHRVTSVLTCSHCGERLERRNVRARRGPGAGDPPLVTA